LVEFGVTDLVVLSFSFDGKYSGNAVYQKMLDLGIASKEEEVSKHNSSSSTTLGKPDELASVFLLTKRLFNYENLTTASSRVALQF
jgi:hypothetical protein